MKIFTDFYQSSAFVKSGDFDFKTWIKAWMDTHKGGLHWLYGKWMSWRLQNKCKLTGRVLCRYIPTSSVQERLDVICSPKVKKKKSKCHHSKYELG